MSHVFRKPGSNLHRPFKKVAGILSTVVPFALYSISVSVSLSDPSCLTLSHLWHARLTISARNISLPKERNIL